jgi:hypothetical protein
MGEGWVRECHGKLCVGGKCSESVIDELELGGSCGVNASCPRCFGSVNVSVDYMKAMEIYDNIEEEHGDTKETGKLAILAIEKALKIKLYQ